MIKLKAPTFEQEMARMKEEAGKWCMKGHWVFDTANKLSVVNSEYCVEHNIHEDTIDVGDEDHIDIVRIPKENKSIYKADLEELKTYLEHAKDEMYEDYSEVTAYIDDALAKIKRMEKNES